MLTENVGIECAKCRIVGIILVPDRRCRVIQEVVIVRRRVFGVWGNRKGEGGERVGSGEVSLQATWD
jgi:hypothetical protein